MAKKEITICDVCGKEVEEGRYYMDEDFSVRIGDLDVCVYAEVVESDLCSPCMQTIYEKVFRKHVLSALEFDQRKEEKELAALQKENAKRKRQTAEELDEEGGCE